MQPSDADGRLPLRRALAPAVLASLLLLGWPAGALAEVTIETLRTVGTQRTVVWSSCSRGEKAREDRELRHSVFFHWVLEGLKGAADSNRNGTISFLELFRYSAGRTTSRAQVQYEAIQRPTLQVTGEFDASLLDFVLASVESREGASVKARAGRFKDYWALLIGVDDYAEFLGPKFAGADVRDMAKQLVAGGFLEKQVVTLHDGTKDGGARPTKANIDRNLKIILKQTRQDAFVLVAFSGYGLYHKGKDCLCPSDTRLGEPWSMIPVDELRERLERSNASTKLLLLDAARNTVKVVGER